MTWQTIDTAKKGPDPIWVYCPGGFQTSVVWHERGWTQDVRSGCFLTPTHWVPLLPPPSEAEGGR